MLTAVSPATTHTFYSPAKRQESLGRAHQQAAGVLQEAKTITAPWATHAAAISIYGLGQNHIATLTSFAIEKGAKRTTALVAAIFGVEQEALATTSQDTLQAALLDLIGNDKTEQQDSVGRVLLASLFIDSRSPQDRAIGLVIRQRAMAGLQPVLERLKALSAQKGSNCSTVGDIESLGTASGCTSCTNNGTCAGSTAILAKEIQSPHTD
ncbi:MAG: hypothetical protein AB7F28_06110 [Candidatus Margulisiibacteriota bacterium]